MLRPQPFVSGTRPAVNRRACSYAHARSVRVCAAAATQQELGSLTMGDALAVVERARQLKDTLPGLKAEAVGVQRATGVVGERVMLVAARDIREGETFLTIPEKLAVTSVDAEAHPLVGALARECGSELVALSLWLLAERAAGQASQHAGLLATLPDSTLTPLLWPDADLEALLVGSPVLPEARARRDALRQQWADLAPKLAADPASFPPAVFNESSFMRAFSVVVGRSCFLPSASCFALLPLASLMGRTGNSNGCDLDYSPEANGVVVRAGRPYRAGFELLLNDGRPNGELLLATGELQEGNNSDFLTWDASLVAADRYFALKSQVLESLGFSAKEQFPVYADRMPIQLLSYLRLARVGDPGLLAKVSFEKDVELSQMNEYEILQILMGDCREKLAAYPQSYEEDVKLAQQPSLTPRQRVAVALRLGEKKIINSTMEAVRRRLAPIRGIPTKTGTMQDPNQDLKEIFDTLESLPTAPLRLLQGLASWARGDDDPDWGAKGRKKQQGGGRK